MTKVLFNIGQDTIYGVYGVDTLVTAKAATRRTSGELLITRNQLRNSDSKPFTLDLAPTGLGQAWIITVSPNNGDSFSGFYKVPSGDTVNFTQLVQIDPETLGIDVSPEPEWWAVANSTINSGKVVNDRLILIRNDGVEVDAGNVRGLPGKDGKDGRDGVNGAPGRDGVNGAPGRDGVSVVYTEINADGDLLVTLSDDQVVNAGHARGLDDAGVSSLIQTSDSETANALSTAIGEQAAPHANTMIIIGPSLEEQNGQGTSLVDPSFSDRYTSSVRARGWFHWFNAAMGNTIELIRNSGIGGDRYDQMVSRFDADVLAYPSDWVFIGSPTNDVTFGRTADAIIADLETMIDKAQTAGRRVLVHNIPPRDSFTTSGRRFVVGEVNRYIADLSITRRGVVPVDIWTPLADPATGYPVAGTTTDGTHYSISGAAILGEATAAAMQGQLVNRPNHISGLADPRRILPNPAFLADGEGWTLLSNTAVTYERVALGYANKAKLAISGNTSTSVPRGISATVYASEGFYVPGNHVQVTARIKWSNLTNLVGSTPCAPVLKLEQFNASGGLIKTTHALYSTTGEWVTDNSQFPKSGEGVFSTWVGTIDPACDRVRLIIGWQGAASVEMEVSDVSPLKDRASTEVIPSPVTTVGPAPEPIVRETAGVDTYVHRWIANEITTADGVNVASWFDAESGVEIAQGGSALQPTVQTVGGVRVVKFDGLDDYLTNASLSEWNSVVIIGRFATDAVDGPQGIFQGGLGGDIGATRATTEANSSRPGIFWSGNRLITAPATMTVPNGLGFVLTMRNDSGDARAEVNGVGVGDATVEAITTAATLDLGRRTTLYGRIEIAEVILYPAGLTDAQMASVRTAALANHAGLFA